MREALECGPDAELACRNAHWPAAGVAGAFDQHVAGLARQANVGDHQLERLGSPVLSLGDARNVDDFVSVPREDALDLGTDDPLVLD